MKALVIGSLLLSPALALYLQNSPADAAASEENRLGEPVSVVVSSVMRVPVEVLAEGKAAEWIYVEVPVQSIPEPGLFSLLALAAGALTLRRSRPA